MLTKSQARWFFLSGTALFAALFIGLTFDTLARVPAQTHAENLTEPVKRGKLIWDQNNCMGCHTILGEGAYYAPELTRVMERRDPEWIRVFIKDPQAMYPGRRKMVKYDFTDEQIDDLIAFFTWTGKMDLNGFPPKPTIKVAQVAQATAQNSASEPAVFQSLCKSCHALGGKGGTVGPALDGVGKKYDTAYLTKWLSDPQSVKPGTAMPKLPLSAEQVTELSDFLSTLK
jgi:nitric oxide reductase subunit C